MRIFALVLIPLLSLIGLYAFVLNLTVGAAVSERQTTQLKNVTGFPIGEYQGLITQEARLALLYLAAPAPQTFTQLQAQEAKTDRAQALMRAALRSKPVAGTSSPEVKQEIRTLAREAAGLAGLRARVASRSIGRLQALARYGAISRAAGGALKTLIFSEKDPSLVSQTLGLLGMSDSENALLMENALIGSDMAAQSFSPADRHQFAELVGARRALFASAEPALNMRDRQLYTTAISPQAQATLTSLENTLIASPATGGPPPVSPATWGPAVAAVSQGFTQAGLEAANDIASHANSVGRTTYLRLWLAGGLGLLAVLLSLLLSVWIGRGLVRQLADLRRSALALASERLPRVMARLRAGENVDLSAEAPPIKASPDEIGQVSEAFNAAARTAIEAAVDQATLRRGVSDVFRSLARRSQSLLHRQLTLLDVMERRANDPEELDDLYRLDHLTTRMRRHAEGLVILSGAAPARTWRKPVRLVDVLRAAVAEIEDYTRVSVVTGSQAALAGPAVADTIHMIAELAENATMFSPPNTPVRLFGDIVGRGFAVEIEDRGLGLSGEELGQLNDRLSNPPEFDLSDSDQLGLFVAGRLAQRHGIAITLRPNPYGGITAIVLIPHELVVDQGDLALDGTGETAVLPTGAPQPAGPDGAAGDGDLAETTVLAGSEAAAGDGESGSAHAAVAPPGWFRSGRPGPGPDLADQGLPQRIRQASLAPQLRQADPQTRLTGGTEPDAPPSPEQVRGTMTAIQRGWERGRTALDGEPGAMGDDPAAEMEITAAEGRDPE